MRIRPVTAPLLLVQEAKCLANRSPSRETQSDGGLGEMGGEDQARWFSAARFIAHQRDSRGGVTGTRRTARYSPGLQTCSGWCITSPRVALRCSPRELEADAGVAQYWHRGSGRMEISSATSRAIHNDLPGPARRRYRATRVARFVLVQAPS